MLDMDDERARRAAVALDRAVRELVKAMDGCEDMAPADIQGHLVTWATPGIPSLPSVAGGGSVPAAVVRSAASSCLTRAGDADRVAGDYAGMADRLEAGASAMAECLRDMVAAYRAVADAAKARGAECRAMCAELEGRADGLRTRAERWQTMHDGADDDLASILLGIFDRLDTLEGGA